MVIIKPASKWRTVITAVLDSKVDEFKLLGYSRTTVDDVWKCLEEKVWKGDPDKQLHQIVQDVFHLSSNIYMSYLTVQSYKNDDLLASIAALSKSEE